MAGSSLCQRGGGYLCPASLPAPCYLIVKVIGNSYFDLYLKREKERQRERERKKERERERKKKLHPRPSPDMAKRAGQGGRGCNV